MRRLRKRHIRLPRRQRQLVAILMGGYIVLLINSLLLYLFERSTALIYMSNMLLHIFLGTLLVAPVAVFLTLHLAKMPIRLNWKATGAGIYTASSLITLLATGFGLTFLGASYADGALLVVHVISAVSAVVGFGFHVTMKQGIRYRFLDWGKSFKKGYARAWRHPMTMTLAGGLGLIALLFFVQWSANRGVVYRADEGGDPLGAAEAVLVHDGYLDDVDLTRSQTCGQAACHPDITAQWATSAHRFSSFNNEWYRKSVEALVERGGNDRARWCASCHDPVVLFAGRMSDDGILDMDHHTAHEGITCLSCHAIEALRDVKGNGRYVMRAPDEYPFARAAGGAAKAVHNTLVRAKPEPHRDAMLKPVHRTSEFCGTCHKVGLPPNVNLYRWKRGQNEYDAWQSSGTSGNTVRSFYLPADPKTCVDCHMPKVPSQDQGNDGGFVRSHGFFAANTALPHRNGHHGQLRGSQEVLAASATVDLFRMVVDGHSVGPEEVLPVLRPGQTVDVTVVVRNVSVGHLLPGGTNDSNELWMELAAEDQEGRTVLISGQLDAKGRVDSTAHFWGAVQVDRASQEISRRNAQDWVATVYMNAIAPGTAHVVHYRFVVPAGTMVVAVRAQLRHRKFKWYFNNWVFRGHVLQGQPDSLARPEVDLRRWGLGSGQAPELPITVMATARRAAGDATGSGRPLWERWNDYGIGLLLEQDTRGALRAFGEVRRIAPESPEGPINEARVHLVEGNLIRAASALEEAERRRPHYLKTAYFRGEVHKADGNYPAALREWGRVHEAYPRDRVLLLNIGRVHYLSGRYQEALSWLDRVLEVDPEDVGALYNRMLALAALGRTEELAIAQARYEYHKEDETALALTGPYKQRHPMANREAQPIHVHELWPVR